MLPLRPGRPARQTYDCKRNGTTTLTELIRPDGPWQTVAAVEAATVGYVHWFNTQRLHGACGGIPPAEYEDAWQASCQPPGGREPG